MLMGCGFDRGALYVTEAGTPVETPDDSYLSNLGDIVRIALNADGSPGTRSLLGQGGELQDPYGLAIGPDGSLYVSNQTMGWDTGGIGEVVRVNP